MTLPRLIAITGNARHGKDTAAAHLVASHGYVRYSLAEPLKEAVLVLFGWSPTDLEGERKEAVDARWGISPRQALQALGTECGQYGLSDLFPAFAARTGRKLWVRRLLERSAAESRVVVSDCRFPHEAEELRAAGGVIVRIVRPGYPVDLAHESERAVDLIAPDYTIVNDRDIAHVGQQLEVILRRWGGATESELLAMDAIAP